jgi:hypothetical protein
MTNIFELETKAVDAPDLGDNVAVRTPTGAVMLKLMKLIKDEKTDEVAILLAGSCILIDGEPIGDRVEQLNAKAFMAVIKLATSEVMPLTGVLGAGE